MIQLHMHIYMYIHIQFFRFFSLIGYYKYIHRILLVIYFIIVCVYSFQRPNLFLLHSFPLITIVCFLCLWVCLANKFIYVWNLKKRKTKVIPHYLQVTGSSTAPPTFTLPTPRFQPSQTQIQDAQVLSIKWLSAYIYFTHSPVYFNHFWVTYNT